MRSRIRLKRKRKIKKTNILLFTLMLCIIGVVLFLNYINQKLTPILLETAELEIGKFSTIVVNKAIAQVLEDKINTEELFDTIISNDGKIQAVDFNPVIVNQVLNIATSVVQNNLKLLEEGNLDTIGIYDMDLPENRVKDLKRGIITKVPIGAITGNSILANLGPLIPIRLHYVGDVNSNITTEIIPYGINNALVKIGVKLEMTAQIILPFLTDKMLLECNIPISIKMIQGSVPSYYGSGFIRDSSMYSIPIEE